MSLSPYSQLLENRMNSLSPAVSSQSIEHSFQTAKFGAQSGNFNFLEIPNSHSTQKNYRQNSGIILRQDSLQSLFEELGGTEILKMAQKEELNKQNYGQRHLSSGVNYQCQKSDEQVYWKSLLINKLANFQREIKQMKNTIEKLKLFIQVQEFQKKYSLKKLQLAIQIYSDKLNHEKQMNEELEKKIKVIEEESEKLKENLSESNKKLMSTILMNSSLTIKIQKLNAQKNRKQNLRIDSEEENSDLDSTANYYKQNRKQLYSQKYADTPKILTQSKTLSLSQSQRFMQSKSQRLNKNCQNKRRSPGSNFRLRSNFQGVQPYIDRIDSLRKRLNLIKNEINREK